MEETELGIINLPMEEAGEKSLLIGKEEIEDFIEALKKLGISFNITEKPDTPVITIKEKPIWVYHVEENPEDPDRTLFLFYPLGVLELHYYPFSLIPGLNGFKAHVNKGIPPITFEVQVTGYTVKGKKYPRLNLPPEFSDLIGKKLTITPLKDGSFLMKVKEE